ncbi:hypothetical protein lerEdw1_000319 [Lerista edwardsae]|nr:hypothetical protein lerEdw1_000319 [Lerista edwardsae]
MRVLPAHASKAMGGAPRPGRAQLFYSVKQAAGRSLQQYKRQPKRTGTSHLCTFRHGPRIRSFEIYRSECLNLTRRRFFFLEISSPGWGCICIWQGPLPRKRVAREEVTAKTFFAACPAVMSSHGNSAPLPRIAAKVTLVGRPLPKHPLDSRRCQGSACQDNSLLRGDEENNELHTPFMNRNDQKKLQEENIRLKHELEDLRSQYDLLIDGKNECFDERRVNLLKAQILQLERQVLLLTEGLSSRAALTLEFNSSLETVTDKLSSFLSTEGAPSEVIIPRPALLQIIETCQVMRLKLQRNHQASDLSKLALPWTLGGNFVIQPITLLDLCYGKIENLNLRYVVRT